MPGLEGSSVEFCEWAAVTAVGKGQWAGCSQQDDHSCRPQGCVCLLWGRDAPGGLTCRSQACCLFLQPPAGLADIKACLPEACDSSTHPQEFLLVLGAQSQW